MQTNHDTHTQKQGKKSYTAERIVLLDTGQAVKVNVNYDASYPHQSHSQVYVWNGSEFALVATGGDKTNTMDYEPLMTYLINVAAVVTNHGNAS
jgi:hypothetical protein